VTSSKPSRTPGEPADTSRSPAPASLPPVVAAAPDPWGVKRAENLITGLTIIQRPPITPQHGD